MKKLLKITLVSSLTLLCFSCYYDEFPKEVKPVIDPGITISFADDILPIFDNYNCTDCHNGGSINPDLRPNNAYNSLVPTYVIAGNANDSRLYIQLLGNHNNQINVSNEDLANLEKWINDGAEPN